MDGRAWLVLDFKTSLSVTEHFCGFVELQRTDAETISSSLLVNLRNWGYDLTNPRWQLNDGMNDIILNKRCKYSLQFLRI
jgi:hypothetical protein